MKPYNYPRAAALDDKAQRLLRRYRSQMFKDEAADERLVRAINRINRLMGPYWRAERNYRIGMRLLSQYD